MASEAIATSAMIARTFRANWARQSRSGDRAPEGRSTRISAARASSSSTGAAISPSRSASQSVSPASLRARASRAPPFGSRRMKGGGSPASASGPAGSRRAVRPSLAAARIAASTVIRSVPAAVRISAALSARPKLRASLTRQTRSVSPSATDPAAGRDLASRALMSCPRGFGRTPAFDRKICERFGSEPVGMAAPRRSEKSCSVHGESGANSSRNSCARLSPMPRLRLADT